MITREPNIDYFPDLTAIQVVGVIQRGHIEMRFVRLDGEWHPDLVVNHATTEVSKPPPCFQMKDDDRKALDAAWELERNSNV